VLIAKVLSAEWDMNRLPPGRPAGAGVGSRLAGAGPVAGLDRIERRRRETRRGSSG
jgi:hypothetical protein